jgi:hypothetical protein
MQRKLSFFKTQISALLRSETDGPLRIRGAMSLSENLPAALALLSIYISTLLSDHNRQMGIWVALTFLETQVPTLLDFDFTG